MTSNVSFTTKGTRIILLGTLLFLSPVQSGAAPRPQITKKEVAEKKAEKRALLFGRRLQSLSQLKHKKSFTQIKKKQRPPVALLQPVPVKLVRIQNLIEQSQMLMRAMPAALPVRGRISSLFGPRRHPRSQDYRLHAGIDIVARYGSPVSATADGRVVFSGERPGYGKVVVLDHGFGFQTVYAHNSQLLVSVGTRVMRGQVIAHVGKSGHTTGTHLHYEVRKNGTAIDPRPYLKKQRPASS